MSEASANVESEVAASAGSPVKQVNPAAAAVQPDAKGDPKPGPSTAQVNESDVLKNAMQKMAAGKRHLLVQEQEDAVASFAEACEILGKFYGETGKECGEAYFYYGKALLELARVEAGVINNVLDGVPDTEDEEESSFVEGPKPTEEESEKIAQDVGNALQENFQNGEIVQKAKEICKKVNGVEVDANDSANGTTNGNGPQKSKNESEENSEDDEEDDDMDENKEKEDTEDASEKKEGEDEEEADDGKENESIASNEAGTSDAKESTDQVAQEAEDEEDPSNLQLAWEMLELAKSILTKHADSLDALSPARLGIEAKLSETYQTLGEVSIENENYPQAVEDFTMCLRRRQELLPEDSRCIAETHYELGVALGFNAQFDEAVNALSDAISVLEKRIALLKESKESQDPAKKKDAFYTREREIEEIEGLIPEVKEKIADTKNMQEETIKKIGDRRLIEEALGVAVASGALPSSSSSALNDALSSSTSESGPSTSSKASTISVSKTSTISVSRTSNISHLVKKRKKSDEEASATNGDVKKPHLETNGSGGASTSSSNGH